MRYLMVFFVLLVGGIAYSADSGKINLSTSLNFTIGNSYQNCSSIKGADNKPVFIVDMNDEWRPFNFSLVPEASGEIQLIYSGNSLIEVAYSRLCVRGAEEAHPFPIAGDIPVNALSNGDFREDKIGWGGAGNITDISQHKAAVVNSSNTIVSPRLRVVKNCPIIVSGFIKKASPHASSKLSTSLQFSTDGGMSWNSHSPKLKGDVRKFVIKANWACFDRADTDGGTVVCSYVYCLSRDFASANRGKQNFLSPQGFFYCQEPLTPYYSINASPGRFLYEVDLGVRKTGIQGINNAQINGSWKSQELAALGSFIPGDYKFAVVVGNSNKQKIGYSNWMEFTVTIES